MDTIKKPRCPEFNEALELLEKTCLNPTYFYGFNGCDFTKIQAEAKEIIRSMLVIFEAKDTDYAANGKPMGNLRSSEEVGVPAWKGTMIRIGDKKQRICSFAVRGSFQVEDEKITDTLKDLANYACIGKVLFMEVHPRGTFGYGYDVDKVLNDFLFLGVRAVHCLLLYKHQSEIGGHGVKWNDQPLEDLKTHFDNIAAFARSK